MKQKSKVFFWVLLNATLLFTMCPANLQAAITITKDSTGTHDGYYYSFWNQGGGSVVMTLGSYGNFGVTWKECSNFICGKGWKDGSPNRVLSFSGNFNGGTDGFLSLYGWAKNPLIEYYVIENYGDWVPPGVNPIGTLTSDAGTYNIYKKQRVNQPSIQGTATFEQVFSVRTSKRSSGTITFSNHINAWKSKGLSLGSTWDYQIMAVEGYKSSGSAYIAVNCSPDFTPTSPPIATPTINISNKKYGDVNNDGIVDSADYSVLRHYLLGKILTLPSYDNADVNGDNTVDSGDYTILRKYLLEEITFFPLESVTS